jgi:hypothetical protein
MAYYSAESICPSDGMVMVGHAFNIMQRLVRNGKFERKPTVIFTCQLLEPDICIVRYDKG